MNVCISVLQNPGVVQHCVQAAADRNPPAEQPGRVVPPAELPDSGEVQRPDGVPERVCRHQQGGAGETVARAVGTSHAAAAQG